MSFTPLVEGVRMRFGEEPPLSWANTDLINEDPVQSVTDMKRDGTRPLRTVGRLTLCRALLGAGLVERFRVVVFR